VKCASSLAERPVIHSVEGVEFREHSAPPQNRTENVKQRRRLKPDSRQNPQKDGPRLEVKRRILPRTHLCSRFFKSLLKNEVVLSPLLHRF
jgi:hypothetical protein